MAIYLGNTKVNATAGTSSSSIDISSTTATQADVSTGKYFYNSSGQRVQGTLQVNTVYVGSSAPSSSDGENGDVYIVE